MKYLFHQRSTPSPSPISFSTGHHLAVLRVVSEVSTIESNAILGAILPSHRLQRGQTCRPSFSNVPSCKGHHQSLQPVLILGRRQPCFLGEAIFVRCGRCRAVQRFLPESSFANAFSAYFSILRTPEPNAPWASKESGSNLIPLNRFELGIPLLDFILITRIRRS